MMIPIWAREDVGVGRWRAFGGGVDRLLSDGSSGDLLAMWVLAWGRAWHFDDDGVVYGGGASLTARQSAARASAADELNSEFQRLEAAGGYES